MGRKADINEGAMNVILVISVIIGLLSWSFLAFIVAVIVLATVMSFMGILR